MPKKNLWVDDGRGYRGPCTADRKPKRCIAMRLALNEERGKGLDIGFLLTFKTGQMRSIVLYRKSASDAGCQVLFCPFCGARVEPEDVAKKDPGPGALRPRRASPEEGPPVPKRRAAHK